MTSAEYLVSAVDAIRSFTTYLEDLASKSPRLFKDPFLGIDTDSFDATAYRENLGLAAERAQDLEAMEVPLHIPFRNRACRISVFFDPAKLNYKDKIYADARKEMLNKELELYSEVGEDTYKKVDELIDFCVEMCFHGPDHQINAAARAATIYDMRGISRYDKEAVIDGALLHEIGKRFIRVDEFVDFGGFGYFMNHAEVGRWILDGGLGNHYVRQGVIKKRSLPLIGKIIEYHSSPYKNIYDFAGWTAEPISLVKSSDRSERLGPKGVAASLSHNIKNYSLFEMPGQIIDSILGRRKRMCDFKKNTRFLKTEADLLDTTIADETTIIGVLEGITAATPFERLAAFFQNNQR